MRFVPHLPPIPPFPAQLTPLPQYQGVTAALVRGRIEGADAAIAWAHAHPGSVTDQQLREAALDRLPPAPTTTPAERDLMRAVQDQRTTTDNVTAAWYAYHGGQDTLGAVLTQHAKELGPDQVRLGQRLLFAAFAVAETADQAAKLMYRRQRPWVEDPTLTPSPGVPHQFTEGPHQYSYPSGHAAGAYAGAAVLSALLPAHRDEFNDLAQQVALSRVYSAMHYPTDVAAGAALGAFIGTAVAAKAAADGRTVANAA